MRASADGPVMRRVLAAHAKVLTWALGRPMALGVVCVALVAATYFGYSALGSDLLPEMDEGGFILDYFTPAGTSLSETNRILQHVEQILRATPEVEITSRRTGLQMGLAAVTEANSGDFTVRLKRDRDAAIDEVMADVRAEDFEDGAGAGRRVYAGAAGHDWRSLELARADPDQAVLERSGSC